MSLSDDSWKDILLVSADVLSFISVTWYLVVFCRLKPGMRRRVFPLQLALLAFADLIMIIGALWQDAIRFGPWKPHHHISEGWYWSCYSSEFVGSFGRIVSILAETRISVTVLCSALRKDKTYWCISGVWLPWFEGMLLALWDMSYACHAALDPTADTFCVFKADGDSIHRPVTAAVIMYGFAVVSLSYGFLGLIAICSKRKGVVRTLLRTLACPASFFCTFGLLIFYRGALSNDTEARSVIIRAAERLNGFVNVLMYSFTLLYCKFCVRAPSSRLVHWGRGSWSEPLASIPAEGSLESVMLAHICYFEDVVADSQRGSPGRMALAPSINAFSVRGCHLDFDPPTLDFLFVTEGNLGSGTFGQVSLMLAIASYNDKIQKDQHYAVKRIRSSTMVEGMDQQQQQSFRCVVRERDTMLLASEHPGVVRFCASFVVQWPELAWILVMEYCPGGSLQDKIDKQGPDGLALTAVRRWAAQTLDALGYLHSKPILHRDLKPANVLLNSAGVCKLADFGLAIESLTAISIRGTPGFFAPEIIFSSNPYSAAADIFSWGKLLLCLFNDQPRVEIRTPGATFKDALLVAGVPESAADLIDVCTADAPDQRPSIAQMKQHAFFSGLAWGTLWGSGDVDREAPIEP